MGKRLIGSVGLKPGTDTGFDLDEKGQIHGYTDTQFALPVGDDDQVLTADSGEASGVKWATASGVSLSGDNTWTGTNIYQDDVTFQAFSAQTRSAKTISVAKITMTTNLATVDTEASASSDDLNEALGVPTSAIICLRAYNADRTVVVKDTVGSVQFIMEGDFSLDNHQDTITFVNFDGTNNYELSRSNNL